MRTSSNAPRHLAASVIYGYIGDLFGYSGAVSARDIVEHLDSLDLRDHNSKLLIDCVVSHLGEATPFCWLVDVFEQVMLRPGVMVTEAVAAEGGVILVKDTVGAGKLGVWMVEAKKIGQTSSMLKSFKNLPFISLTGHCEIKPETYCIRAVNLSSCLKLKTIK